MGPRQREGRMPKQTPEGRPKGAGPGWARVNAKAGCRSRRPKGARRVRAQDGPASTRRQDAEADARRVRAQDGPASIPTNPLADRSQSFFSIFAVFFRLSI